jgi:hypothetical protein
MWYVGSRTAEGCYPEDGYSCSSKTVKPLIEGLPNEWKREIIATGIKEEMLALEEEILMTVDARSDPRSFNRTNNVMRKDGSSVKGKKRIHLNDKQLTVTQSELSLFLKLGWKLGFPNKVLKKLRDNVPDYRGEKNPMYGVKRNSPTKGVKLTKEQTKNFYKFGVKECEHCGIACSEGNYARWHGTKCKQILVATELNVQIIKGEF